jgi:hypothetical protein
MSTTIFERIALAQLLVGGCAVVVASSNIHKRSR